MVSQDVAREIRRYMDKRGIRRNKFADVIGVSQSKMYSMVNGQSDLRMYDYLAICDALEVSPTYFIALARAREIRGGKRDPVV